MSAGDPFTRRTVMALGAGGLALVATRPAVGANLTRDEAIRAFTGGAAVTPGRVKLDLPPLVENGNSAPLEIVVESPMTEADHVRRIAVFNAANPQPNVITAHLGPRAGQAKLATRIRLATSQRITAIAALSDGSYWSGEADVIVTLAACVEG